jgi:ABC-2 type transport system permease protein
VRRALLVARREFLEHVRTKGFWLSLVAVPFALVLALAIPALDRAARPVLSFAVTDRSGWLLEDVVRDADRRDLARLLERLDAAEAPSAPQPVRDLLGHWRARAPEARDRWLHELLGGTGYDAEAGAEAAVDAQPETAPEAFLTWWRSRTPPQIAAFAPDAWRARFHLVHRPDRWTPPAEARTNLAAERIFAWIEIPEDPVGSPERPGAPLDYTARNLTNRDLRDWFEARAGAVLERQRRREADLAPALWAWVSAPPALEVRTLAGPGGRARAASAGDVLGQWGPVAFVYILWVSVLVVTQMLVTSTVEEKSNKLVEVLLATLSPVELMAGKILGIGATGLAIVGTWLATFAAATAGLPALLGAPPALGLTALVAPAYLGAFLVYFTLGYFLYAALLAGLGAVCSSLKEAQTLVIPVQGILFVPLATMIPIARDPAGTLATVLTWLPPFTPFVMMNRAAQPPEPWVYAGTTLLLLASIGAAVWAGAKVFRIGILMTGQPPKLREVLRWMAAPVGPAGAARPAVAADRGPDAVAGTGAERP